MPTGKSSTFSSLDYFNQITLPPLKACDEDRSNCRDFLRVRLELQQQLLDQRRAVIRGRILPTTPSLSENKPMDRGAREHRGPWEDLDRTPRRQRSQCAYAHNNGRVHRANNNPTTTDRKPRSHPPTLFRRQRQPSSQTERRAAISLQILPGRSLTTGHRQQHQQNNNNFW